MISLCISRVFTDLEMCICLLTDIPEQIVVFVVCSCIDMTQKEELFVCRLCVCV